MAAKVRKKSEPTKRWTRFFCFTRRTRLPFHLPLASVNVIHQSLAMFDGNDDKASLRRVIKQGKEAHEKAKKLAGDWGWVGEDCPD